MSEKRENRAWYLVAWIVLLLLGALIRLKDLGQAPLSPAEVAEALMALSGQAGSGAASSGLLVSSNRFLFWALGASDAVARLVPAVVGALLPLLALLFKPWLGRRGAWIAGVLLAVSPSLVLFSRTASGLVPGLAAILVVLASVFIQGENAQPSWRWWPAVCIGLGVAAGPAFISLATTLLLAWLAARMGSRERWLDWQAIGLGLAVLVLGSTTLLFFPAGLGVTADGLGRWLAGFGLHMRDLGQPFAILLFYEPLVALAGLAGAWRAARGGSTWQRLLLFWLLLGSLLALFRPLEPDAPFLVLAPLLLLAASFLSDLAGELADSQMSVEFKATVAGSTAVLCILMAHIVVSAGQYASALGNSSPAAGGSLMLVGISVILVLGVGSLLATYSRKLAVYSLLIALLVILLPYTWGRAWELGHTNRMDPRELWIGEAPAIGQRLLVDTLAIESERVTGNPWDIQLTVKADSPTLRWVLRDMANVQWVDALQPGVITEAVLTPVEESPLLGDSYLGADMALQQRESTDTGRMPVPGEALRWLLLRDGPPPEQTEWVILWVRQDIVLAGGN